jgi:tetratricopeptide (TPR) repeat protein
LPAAAAPAACFSILLLCLLTSCGGKPAAQPVHLAIVRFENLGDSAEADWMGRAFSEIIAAELPAAMVIPGNKLHSLDRTLAPRPASAPGVSTERSEAILAGANRIAYGDYTVKGGRIDARLTVEDAASGRMPQVLSASAPDVVTAASSLARQLSPQASAYATRNPDAIRYYVLAREGGDIPLVLQNADKAIAAAPDFGAAYQLKAEVQAEQHDRDGALATLAQALARGSAIAPAARARMELEAAGLRNDFGARQQALDTIAKTNPQDADSWMALAQTAYARHDYPKARDAFQQVLRIHPGDVNALNMLAYAQASAGDLQSSLATLRRYQSLRPKEANPLDSEGDVQLMYGHMKEAEDLYLEADKRDRKFLAGGDLFKAAMARLMTGDVAGATTLAKQFSDIHGPIQQAEWLWISGHRKAAFAQLQGIAESQKELAGRAYVDLAFFALEQGDRAAATQWAVKAQANATQATAVDAVVARFLSQQPGSAAEWETRAGLFFRNVPQQDAKDLTLAYALLLDRHFAEAATVLRRVYGGPTSDPGIPILLAWSLIESGHRDEAAPLLRFNPVPPPGGVGPFMGFYFPRFFELRGDRQLFQKLSE